MTDASVNRSSHRLVSPAELKALSQRSDARGLVRLALHAGLIGLSSYAIWRTQGTLWVLPSMLVQGLFLVSLFATIHETVHYTAFRSRQLNEAVGWLAALPSMLNSTYYKHFHLAHHRHTQDPARDPELTPPPPATRGEFWWRITAIPYWIGRFRSLGKLAVGNFAGADFVPEKARGEVVRSVRLLDRPGHPGPALPARLSADRAYRLQRGCERPDQHPDHAGLLAGPAADVEHAVPCRASPLPLDPVPRPAGAARQGAGRPRPSGAGLPADAARHSRRSGG